jgi:hypothetical protein
MIRRVGFGTSARADGIHTSRRELDTRCQVALCQPGSNRMGAGGTTTMTATTMAVYATSSVVFVAVFVSVLERRPGPSRRVTIRSCRVWRSSDALSHVTDVAAAAQPVRHAQRLPTRPRP